jgi:hypothetical protein
VGVGGAEEGEGGGREGGGREEGEGDQTRRSELGLADIAVEVGEGGREGGGEGGREGGEETVGQVAAEG